MNQPSLTRFAWLSIGAAVATICLKLAAYLLTGSVGLLSDAIESVVNLLGAIVALAMLTIAANPPDEEHAYGHSKAEYFSSGVEGTLIVLAAVTIAATAGERLMRPQAIDDIGVGLAISVVASFINLVVARALLRAGRHYSSIALEADGRHLMTDVWTSGGVVLGVAAVAITGWQRLDPLIALIVAANILREGWHLLKRTVSGLMDTALSVDKQDAVRQVLAKYERDGIQFHAMRTRRAGARQFVSLHVLVPGNWSVQRGHQLLENIEADIRHTLSNVTVFTHLEPVGDTASWQDMSLDRGDQDQIVGGSKSTVD